MKTFLLGLALLAAVSSSLAAGCPRGEDVLLERWGVLWEKLEERGAQGEHQGVYRELADRYCEPHRAYHNLAHVEHLLNELDVVRQLAHDAEALELALWFHDVVYEIGAPDNEERSARLAREAVRQLGLGDELAQRVATLILATRHTEAPESLDAQLMVDLDLTILGQPRADFDAYEEHIRAEYAPLIVERGVERFNAGRAAILRRFLERPAIYSIESLRRKYEDTARANLRHSIARLEDPSWTESAVEGQNRSNQ